MKHDRWLGIIWLGVIVTCMMFAYAMFVNPIMTAQAAPYRGEPVDGKDVQELTTAIKTLNETLKKASERCK